MSPPRRAWHVVSAGSASAGMAWLLVHYRSPMVRVWRPGGGEQIQAGELSVRTFGAGDRVFVLLHGITASGDIWGAAWDGLGRAGRVVVPDLLGFGRSMDESRSDFSLDAHLAALDGMHASLDLGAHPLTVVGHSLGGLLALHWAARRAETAKVVSFSAPLYRDATEADARIQHIGLMERLFAQGPIAEATCAWLCAHRSTAQWVLVLLEPQWPVAITRMGARHTWPSYIGAMDGIIRRGGWEGTVATLDAKEVPVVLANGARDPVPVPGRADELAAHQKNVTVLTHPTADHELPITYPHWCLEFLRG